MTNIREHFTECFCCRCMKLLLIILSFSFLITLQSCSENPQEPVSINQDLIYQKSGLIDSIVGTCSTFLIRNFTLDTINFSSYSKAILEKDAFTDGDLSEIIVYYLNSDTAVNVLNLQGKDMINSTGRIEFQPPKDTRNYYLRLKLYSSVCTGQLFHLKLRDLKIYGVN